MYIAATHDAGPSAAGKGEGVKGQSVWHYGSATGKQEAGGRRPGGQEAGGRGQEARRQEAGGQEARQE